MITKTLATYQIDDYQIELNIFCYFDGTESYCYSVWKNGKHLKKFPRTVAWLGTGMVNGAQAINPLTER